MWNPLTTCAGEDLVEKYTGHPGVDTDKIEEVDFVWQGESYAELTREAGFL